MNNPVKMKANQTILLISLFLVIQQSCQATQKSQLGQPLIQLSHGKLSIQRGKLFCSILSRGSRVPQYPVPICMEQVFWPLTLYAFLVESINTKNIKNSSLTAAKIWDNQYELIAKTER